MVVPDQSMGLKEIIKRFIRKESLPIQKQGFYEDRFGDLEKMANEDIVVQLERAKEIGDYLARAKAHMDKVEADKAAAAKIEADKAAERQRKLDELLTAPVKE